MIPNISSLDYAISESLNQIAQQTPFLNTLLDLVAVTHPLKGGVMMLVIWWVWFSKREQADDRRIAILSTLVGAIAGVVVTRAVVLAAPFRPRPLYNAALNLQIPPGVENSYLDKLSSFPSDHASLFIALAIGLFYISRRLGWAGLLYSLFLICLPRVYLGFHYSSDVVVGGLIGIACVAVAHSTFVRKKVLHLGLNWSRVHPASFYCCLFVASYQIVNQFDEARAAGHLLIDLFRTTAG